MLCFDVRRLFIYRCSQKDLLYVHHFFYSDFIEEKLGSKYVKNRTMEFAKSFEEASPSTPIFFILSPGVNPLKDVEQLGKQLGYTEDNGNFHNVSLGQGQEVVAEIAMDEGAQKGHWVILQVILKNKCKTRDEYIFL